MTIPYPVVVVVTVLLGAAAFLVLVRLGRGPTLLDRVVAVDTLMAVIVCGLGVHATVTGNPTYVPVLLALSLLGFVGSVSLARFGPVQDHRPFEKGQSPTGSIPQVHRDTSHRDTSDGGAR